MNLNNTSENLSHNFDLQQRTQNRIKSIVLLNNNNLNNSVSTRSSTDQMSLDSPQFNSTLMNKPQDQAQYQHSSIPQPNNLPQPSYNKSMNYYQEFWRMYLHNELLITQMKDVLHQNKEIEHRIHNLNNICQELEASLVENYKKETRKKNRRTASEIEKSFTCPYPSCNKNYGSDVSLNLHIKLKHNGGNKTEREKLARSILWAQMNGEKVPDVKLNLPPGFLNTVNTSRLLKEVAKDGLKNKDRARDKDNLDSDTNSEKARDKLSNQPNSPFNEEADKFDGSSDKKTKPTSQQPFFPSEEARQEFEAQVQRIVDASYETH